MVIPEGPKFNSIRGQPVPDNISHKLWTDDQRHLVVDLKPARWAGFTMGQDPAVTRIGRPVIPSVTPSCPSERGGLRTDVDGDGMANNGVIWYFRWWEAVLLHDDAAPPEGSTGEQQRAGRRGRVLPPRPLVDEEVLTGS